MQLSQLEVVTLFVPDIVASRRFYERVFEARVLYSDAVSAVFDFGGTMINLLAESEAVDLIAPGQVAPAAGGARMLLTIKVDSVDAEHQRLEGIGVVFLNGPQDRPWGRRTASFLDPAGHAWELAQDIS